MPPYLLRGDERPEGDFMIISRENGRAIGLKGGDHPRDRVAVKAWERRGILANQAFKIRRDPYSPHLVVLHSASNPDYVLDVSERSKDAGASLIFFKDKSTHYKSWEEIGNQRFGLFRLPDGEYMIKASHSDKILDLVLDDAHVEGGRIVQWDENAGYNQRWWLFRVYL